MANPQVENGYVKISNDIFDALSRIRISGEARQILDVIFRKTYGFNKKQDAISLSQFCLSTGMKKPEIVRAIKKLIDMNIICKKANGLANIYSINKDFDTWKPLAKKQRGVTKKQIIVGKKANNRWQKSHIQKTVSKDSIKRHSYFVDEKLKTNTKKMKDIDYSDDGIQVAKPRKKAYAKMTKQDQSLYMAVGALWVNMVQKKLKIDANDIPYRGIILLLRPIKEKRDWKYKDFEDYFSWFLTSKINDEDKISFNLALNEKMIAKYLIAKKKKDTPVTLAQVATEIRL